MTKENFAEDQETCDAFLDGKIHLHQPKHGYRAGVDPVFLAAATPAKPGQSVLELGCGAGAASLCLHARVDDLNLTGIEIQSEYANLARKNAQTNHAAFQIIQADLRHLPEEITSQQFDHVIANPPYYLEEKHTASKDSGRNIALAGDTELKDWVKIAAKRVKPKGYVTLIQRADRLPELLCACQKYLGSIRVKALSARTHRPASLVLLQARKLGRADFILDPPLILHQGDTHERDGESYRKKVLGILRNGDPLIWED